MEHIYNTVISDEILSTPVKHLYDVLIFNGISNCQGLLHAKKFGNQFHFTLIFTYFV